MIQKRSEQVRKEVVLGPDNAMNGRRGCASNRANRIRFRGLPLRAIKTLRSALPMEGHLSIVPGGAGLDEGHVGRDAHGVHVTTRVQVVERVHHDIKLPKPSDIVLWFLDVGVMRGNVDIGVKVEGRLFGHLVSCKFLASMEGEAKGVYLRLGLVDMLLLEKKLSVQVAQIDRIQVQLGHRERPVRFTEARN